MSYSENGAEERALRDGKKTALTALSDWLKVVIEIEEFRVP